MFWIALLLFAVAAAATSSSAPAPSVTPPLFGASSRDYRGYRITVGQLAPEGPLADPGARFYWEVRKITPALSREGFDPDAVGPILASAEALSAEAAGGAAAGWVDLELLGKPDAPPVPTPEGAGGPLPPAPTPTTGACDRTYRDGDAVVCLHQKPGGWSWTWTRGETVLENAPDKLEATSADARVAAYFAARETPIPAVVPEAVVRFGVRLHPTGQLDLVDTIGWGLGAYPRLRSEWTQGERDPMGLALAALQAAFPGVNWFRIRLPGGGAAAAVTRIGAVLHNPNAPDVVDRVARAIVGGVYDPRDHVFRGRRVRLRSQTIPVQGQGGLGGAGIFWSFRVGEGAWQGQYNSEAEALEAAHGAVPQPAGIAVGG